MLRMKWIVGVWGRGGLLSRGGRVNGGRAGGSPGVSGISLHAIIRCSAGRPALHPNPAVGGPVVGGTCCVLVCVSPGWPLFSYSRDPQQAVGEGPVAVLCSLH